ncbi:MAG: hypothetical protein ACNS63_04540 [Candidatus Nitrospinota bacterium M3_3B_026]
MEKYLIPLILVLGAVVAALITRWANWYTWGENMYKKKMTAKRMEARARARKEKEEGPDGDDQV